MLELLEKIVGEQLNIYLLTILLLSWIMITKLEFDSKKLNVKFSLIYIVVYLLAVFNILDIKFLLIIVLIISFIFLEIIYLDELAKKIINKKLYYIYDYLYKIVFEYKCLYFVLSLIIISNRFKKDFIKIPYLYDIYDLIADKINIRFGNYILIFISALLILIGVVKIINNRFKTLNFSEIKDKMDSIQLFSKFKPSNELLEFSKILIYKEDRSFFKRKNSYNWFSIEFIKYRLKRIYESSNKFKICSVKIIGKIVHIFLFIYYLLKNSLILLFRILKNILNIIIKVFILRKNIKNYLRGYSTIEMQLIRTLSVKDGYSSNVLQRKAYEFCYSKVYFDSLKQYYEYHIYANISDYKLYLIYIYIMIAPVKINGVLYKSILNLFEKEKLENITIEEFYIWVLGLSHKKIDYDILSNTSVLSFKMNKSKIEDLILKFS